MDSSFKETEQLEKMQFPHLHLVDWPFHVVPKDEHCSFIADRKQVQQDMINIFRNLSRRDASTIHVIWAYYGAGKTHTLKYISYRCKKDFSTFIPIYIEFPKDTHSFLDLYKSFIEKFDIETLQETFLEVFTSPKKDEARRKLHQDFPDLFNALSVLSQEKPDKVAIANYWLRAQNIPMRDLRTINLTTRIDGAEKALKVITWLITLFSWAHSDIASSTARIIWMIDEFQRMTKCRKPVQDEINGCLQSVYNRCPSSFTLFLSFSGDPSDKMPSWLSREVADRIGMEPIITLPPLSLNEAKQFIRDVLTQFRGNIDSAPSPIFPFSKNSIDAIVEWVNKKGKLKPRSIMQACDAVLKAADPKIESKTLQIVDTGFVSLVLKDRTFVETEDIG